MAGQDGVRRFNSSGVVIRVAAGIVNGRVYLKDGGYYDDVYEKTTCGAGLQACQVQWRFKTRVYMQ